MMFERKEVHLQLPQTVDSYIEGLFDAFIILRADRYDIRGRDLLKTGQKYYASDMGLRRHVLGGAFRDYGRVLENLVYLELVRRFAHVRVGSLGSLEVDFVSGDEGSRAYWQVAASVRDEATLERELRPLRELRDNYPKWIIILDDDPPMDYDGIRQISAFDFFLGKQWHWANSRKGKRNGEGLFCLCTFQDAVLEEHTGPASARARSVSPSTPPAARLDIAHSSRAMADICSISCETRHEPEIGHRLEIVVAGAERGAVFQRLCGDPDVILRDWRPRLLELTAYGGVETDRFLRERDGFNGRYVQEVFHRPALGTVRMGVGKTGVDFPKYNQRHENFGGFAEDDGIIAPPVNHIDEDIGINDNAVHCHSFQSMVRHSATASLNSSASSSEMEPASARKSST